MFAERREKVPGLGRKPAKFRESTLIQKQCVIAVIHPPKDGTYLSIGMCQVLNFMSKNAENHFRNWEKDGILLVKSMPTEKEIIAMSTVLWDDEKFLHPWQNDICSLHEEKLTEIRNRIELIGPISRLFSSDLLGKAIVRCLQDTEVDQLRLHHDISC